MPTLNETFTDVYGDVWTHTGYGIFADGRGSALPLGMIPSVKRAGRAGYRAGYDHARAAQIADPVESAYVASDRGAAEWPAAEEEFIRAFYAGVTRALTDISRISTKKA